MNIAAKIILGTAQMGLKYGINNPAGQIALTETEKILKYSFENNIKFIDTSNSYGDAEERIGQLAKKNHLNFNIINKISRCNVDLIDDVIESSFAKLETARYYGYLCHQFDFYLESPIVWNKLQSLKTNGRVEKIGFSLYTPEQLDELFKRKTEFDLIQVPFNIFDQRFYPYFQECQNRGIEVHIRSIFLQGLFFKNVETLPAHFLPVFEKLSELHKYAALKNISMSSLMILFATQICRNEKIVMGVDNLDNMISNLNAGKCTHDIDYDYLKTFNESNLDIIMPVKWRL